MKRWIGSLVLTLFAAVAMAQAPFTIVRPADGSKVREKVRILIPKNSIPSGGYVGVFVGGKFIEALVPPLVGQHYQYTLDTKGRKIPDGKLNIEVVLFVDYNEQPRIVDRSSIDVYVANSASIAVPNRGFTLRYNYRPGTKWVYALMQNVSLSTITEAQNQLGGRPAETSVQNEKIRLLYAVENSYGNGDGLVRIQPLPLKGKDHAYLTTSADTENKRYMEYEMAPLYMRLTSSGMQVWGSVPTYVPMEGTSGEGSVTDLVAAAPLPTLPAKSIRPGETYPARFQYGKLDLENLYFTNNFVHKLPARGEFVGVEWEMGHPCAKLRHTLEFGAQSLEGQKLAAAGRDFTDEKIAMDETIWFALDRRQVMKIVRNITIDQRGQGGAGGGGANPGGGRGGLRAPGGDGGGFGADRNMGPGDLIRQLTGGLQGAGPATGSAPAAGQRGGEQRGGAAGGGQFVRLRITQIFVLEK